MPRLVLTAPDAGTADDGSLKMMQLLMPLVLIELMMLKMLMAPMLMIVMLTIAVFVNSCPGIKSRAMDRCFCWIAIARVSTVLATLRRKSYLS